MKDELLIPIRVDASAATRERLELLITDRDRTVWIGRIASERGELQMLSLVNWKQKQNKQRPRASVKSVRWFTQVSPTLFDFLPFIYFCVCIWYL